MKEWMEQYYAFTVCMVALLLVLFIFGFDNRELVATGLGAIVTLLTAPKERLK